MEEPTGDEERGEAMGEDTSSSPTKPPISSSLPSSTSSTLSHTSAHSTDDSAHHSAGGKGKDQGEMKTEKLDFISFAPNAQNLFALVNVPSSVLIHIMTTSTRQHFIIRTYHPIQSILSTTMHSSLMLLILCGMGMCDALVIIT
jgi:hypothetical protein